MEKDFKLLFKKLIEPTDDINVAMFGFGVCKGNRDFLRLALELNNPIKDRLKTQWDNDIWLETIRASDPEDPEDHLYSLEGADYPLYQIEKAVKFERPTWVFYYLMGVVLGEYMSSEFNKEELKLILENVLEHLSAKDQEQLKCLVDSFIVTGN